MGEGGWRREGRREGVEKGGVRVRNVRRFTRYTACVISPALSSVSMNSAESLWLRNRASEL